eukprot:CAMPEP_0175082442 /NCGR_PEP_ID=MMETSP0052_2-20121109/26757_1 /TAXON_ID=51329 ORGANISM="Polytomella parva, Strain SAG 63-3" /NCGR_SAMPLE_ID=MMETSP0052_2 /ASSEMBLY_ACC=CAM_ASM_000194 /LENGTH=366 /DNA_ID=CAMNT_0016353637 /DNA_START=525 /DNA_END=1623 /DNA_ORIENTATION=-
MEMSLDWAYLFKEEELGRKCSHLLETSIPYAKALREMDPEFFVCNSMAVQLLRDEQILGIPPLCSTFGDDFLQYLNSDEATPSHHVNISFKRDENGSHILAPITRSNSSSGSLVFPNLLLTDAPAFSMQTVSECDRQIQACADGLKEISRRVRDSLRQRRLSAAAKANSSNKYGDDGFALDLITLFGSEWMKIRNLFDDGFRAAEACNMWRSKLNVFLSSDDTPIANHPRLFQKETDNVDALNNALKEWQAVCSEELPLFSRGELHKKNDDLYSSGGSKSFSAVSGKGSSGAASTSRVTGALPFTAVGNAPALTDAYDIKGGRRSLNLSIFHPAVRDLIGSSSPDAESSTPSIFKNKDAFEGGGEG